MRYLDLKHIPETDRCEVLWKIALVIGGSLKTPEERMHMDRFLRRFLSTIQDKDLRTHYQAWVRHKRAELYAPHRLAISKLETDDRAEWYGRTGLREEDLP
jgi:hypothetical protein